MLSAFPAPCLASGPCQRSVSLSFACLSTWPHSGTAEEMGMRLPGPRLGPAWAGVSPSAAVLASPPRLTQALVGLVRV